jgi:hypothetical protein
MSLQRKIQRYRPRFIKVRAQLLVIVPAMVFSLISIFVGFLCLHHLKGQVSLLFVEKGLSEAFGGRVQSMMDIVFMWFWILSFSLLAITFVWYLILSFRIFGPLERIERELEEIQGGKKDLSTLNARQGDVLFSFIQMVREALSRF